MKKSTKWFGLGLFLFSFFVLVAFFLPFSLRAVNYPESVGYVNDFGEMLSSDFEEELETRLNDFEKETQAEMAVVTIKNLGNNYLEGYAVGLFEAWGIGKKDEDNGLLLLIAKEERQVRIEVGYGLEPVVTDVRAGRVIREQITPNFKNEDYDQGVDLATQKLMGYIRSGEPASGTEEVQALAKNNLPWFVFSFIILIYLAAFWSRSKRVWPGGVVGGLLGIFLSLALGSFIFIFLLALFGLFLDWLLSKNYKKRKKLGKSTRFFKSWGGFSGGGFKSGGGFGGFGGGSSGGGGASGGW